MGAYLNSTDLENRVGLTRLTQLLADTGSAIDSAVLDEVIDSAEGEINGYLARRYATPVDLTSHPDLAATLKGYALDVASYRAHARRPPAPEDIRKSRDDAIAWLKLVSEGKVVLPAATTPATTNADDPKPTWGSSPQNAARLREL